MNRIPLVSLPIDLATARYHTFQFVKTGRGDGAVVSVLFLISDYPSSNPAEIYSFLRKILLVKFEINQMLSGRYLNQVVKYS